MRVMFIDTVHAMLQERLEKSGFECVDHTNSEFKTIKKEIGNFHGLVIRSRFTLNAALIDLADKLRFIARSGSGMENIDVAYAETKGIKCYNASEGNANAVGEHALGMLLALMRKLNIADAEVRRNIWEREGNRGEELEGKTIGIIGYGNTGCAFAKKLRGFDVKVLATDKYESGFGNEQVQECTPAYLQEHSDIVSLHVPLTDETRYMVNDAFLAGFKKPIRLINTSRGAVVNTEELVDNMKKGKVLGACLDVLEYEKHSLEGIEEERPEALQYLMNSPLVVLTPHIAGWTVESYRKLSEVLADRILKDFPNGKVI